MDSVEIVALARALIDIDSTTGGEGEVCRWLAEWLRGRNYSVREQPLPPLAGQGFGVAGRDVRVSGTKPLPRMNLLATTGANPEVILSTHLDCVPPFFASSVEGETLHGRGSCDAKGIAAAQVAACERLRAAGEERVGLLFVVGEERGSDGAKAAAQLAADVHPRFVINGEPTESTLAAATRGVWRVKIRARGRAAHSAFPELGESAITKLVDALTMLRGVELPTDPVLGRTSYIVALISGGVAPNVVPPQAEAEVTFRTVGPARDLLAVLESLLPAVELEHVLEVPVERFHAVPGFTTQAFPFTTDAPFLRPFGRVLLFGPGSARVAHTDHERIEIAELHAAADEYEQLVRRLIAE